METVVTIQKLAMEILTVSKSWFQYAEYTDDGKVKNVTYKFESEIDDLDENGTKDYLRKVQNFQRLQTQAV